MMTWASGLMLTLALVYAATDHLDPLRLPRHLLPSHYRIKLIPFLSEDNFTTNGEVWIELDCIEIFNKVVFNVNNMTIYSDFVKLQDLTSKEDSRIVQQKYNKTTEQYSILVYPSLVAGHKYLLYVKFVSVLNNLLQGLYRSSYVDSESRQRRWLATSQFSPTDARRAFPSWDEPQFKANFTISLGRPVHLHSWSNMPINCTSSLEGMNGWVWDNYLPTVPMSTYLVAFMVSDLQSSGKTTLPSGLQFQIQQRAQTQIDLERDNLINQHATILVIARKDELAHTKYAASVGPKILMYLEDYFNISFPLPKLDLAAIPDFGYMAMENWGLITFRESVLLYNMEGDGLLSHRKAASVIGHELAHQWFGNLVTPAWWDDLWLKEGFATYIGCLAISNVEPEWRHKELFVVDNLQPAMVLDSLLSSHQISLPLDNLEDISQIFDSISYMKGASIIRMMEHFMTTTDFKAGLTAYLQQYAYNNTRQDQLWQVLSEHRHGTASLPDNATVKDIMDSWTLQVGYPVITVTRDYKAGTALLRQERFLLSGRGECECERQSWWVPISYTSENTPHAFSDTQPQLWLTSSQHSASINNLPADQWLIVNINQTGFYRVNYDSRNWALLTADFQQLPELARAQLLNDALSLARAGQVSYRVALNLTRQLLHDHSHLTWSAVNLESKYIHDMLAGTETYQVFKKYVLKLLHVKAMNLTLDPNSLPSGLLDRLHHCDIIMLACRLDYPPLVAEVRALTSQWMGGGRPRVTADLKSTVYCTAVANGNQEVWQYFWSLYLSSESATEREQLLGALGCSQDVTILSRYLDMILDEKSSIRKQDGAIVFTSVAHNKNGYHLAFDFLANRWHDIQEYFGLGFRRVSHMVLSLSRFLKTQQYLEQLKVLQANHSVDLGSTAQAFRHTIELVSNNVQWFCACRHEIDEWLSQAVNTI